MVQLWTVSTLECNMHSNCEMQHKCYHQQTGQMLYHAPFSRLVRRLTSDDLAAVTWLVTNEEDMRG